MSNVKNELVIDLEEPFKNCKFERQEQANILENVIKYTKDNVVINLTAPWGYGKTTFLKMLQQQMNNNKLTCIYFSAWEYDYVEDPFSALIGHLYEELKVDEHIKDKGRLEAIFKKATPIVGNIALKVATANVLNIDMFSDISDGDQTNISTDIGQYGEKLISQYMNTSKSIEMFKKNLELFASKQNEQQVIIIVDELDRCRPDFSIEMLERIKHIMSVNGVKFILGTDKEQLAESIKVLYGNNFDSVKYLERFIDFEYKLDIPDLKNYITILIDEFKIYDLSLKKTLGKLGIEDIIKMSEKLFTIANLDLRTIRQIIFNLHVSLISIDSNNYKKMYFEYLLYKLIKNKLDDKNKDIYDKEIEKIYTLSLISVINRLYNYTVEQNQGYIRANSHSGSYHGEISKSLDLIMSNSDSILEQHKVEECLSVYKNFNLDN